MKKKERERKKVVLAIVTSLQFYNLQYSTIYKCTAKADITESIYE